MYKMFHYNNHHPKIDNSAFIADGAIIIGDVTIGSNSSVWFNSVLRGDVESITIGSNTNIQDGSIIHTSRFQGPTIIGNNVTVGHMALLHACTIKDNAFIGMRSVVMDFAVVEEFAFVAAGALVTPKKIVKSGELWAGNPAKFVRYISDDERSHMIANTDNYIKLAKDYS